MNREPRSRTIARHVESAQRTTGIPFNALADRAVDLYHARTALHERTLEFASGTTAALYERASRLNAQQVRRMLDGAVRLPVDFEEALVLALPDSEREACLRELAGRYGLLAAAQPASDGAGQQTNLAGLLLETGELMTALAPAFVDGVLDERDAAAAAQALPEALGLQAKLATLCMELESALRKARATTTNVLRMTR